MDKIKVNLSYRTYNILLGDMSAFGFVKEDGDINRNAFLNQLVRNFYKLDQPISEAVVSKIDSSLTALGLGKEKANPVKDDLIRILSDRKFHFIASPKECSLSFRPLKGNDLIFEEIEDNLLQGRTISDYFRTLFDDYASLSQAERECLLFYDRVTLLDEAISKHREIVMTLTDHKARFEPYDLVTTGEEAFTYALGFVGKTLFSFHLYKMGDLVLSGHSFTPTTERREAIEQIIHDGPDYVSGDVITARVRLTPAGEKKLGKIWHGRPQNGHREGDVYVLTASSFQLASYFERFGKDAVILSPASLRNEIMKYYQDGLSAYADPKGEKAK